MNHPLCTRVATAEEWSKLATKCSDRLRPYFLAGEVPVYDDRAGTRRVLPPGSVVPRQLDEATLVTRAAALAPSPTPTAPPNVSPSPTPPTKVPSPTVAPTDDLRREFFDGLLSPEERDVVDRLDRRLSALPTSTPATPRAKASNVDTRDLLAELNRGIDRDLADEREPEPRRDAGDVSDLVREFFGGDA